MRGDSEGRWDECPSEDIPVCPEVSRQSAPKQDQREPKHQGAFNDNVEGPFPKPINFLQPLVGPLCGEAANVIPDISVDPLYRKKRET